MFDIHYISYYIVLYYIVALQRSLAIQNGRGMDLLSTDGQRGMELSTKLFAVVKSQQPPLMSWRHGKKLFSSLHLPGMLHKIFTMVMKQPCFTSLCLIGLIVSMGTSLLVHQNVRTDSHCLLLQTWMGLTTENWQ